MSRNRFVNAFQRGYEWFRSARVTISILLTLLLLFMSGLFIPQKALFPSLQEYAAWKAGNPFLSRAVESLGLNEVYVAPVTILFLALFFLNLIAVLIHRVPVILRRSYLMSRGRTLVDSALLNTHPNTRVIRTAGGNAASSPQAGRAREVLAQTELFFRRRMWTIIASPAEASFLAVRNRYAPFGFILFHASFLLCLIGGLLVMYTRFSGDLVLTEGERFDADLARFSRITRQPKIFQALPPVSMELEKVVPRYEGNVATDLSVNVRVSYWSETDEMTLKINDPVKRGPLLILAQNVGVSPLFVLRNAKGAVIDAGYVSLNVLKGGEDSFEFPGAPYKMSVRFYPDHARSQDGKDYSRTVQLTNPVVHMQVTKKDRIVYEGNIAKGGSSSFDNVRLEFEDVRYWVNFLVVREYGALPLYAGFLLGAIGLVMRLVLYQKTVKVHIEEAGEEVIVRLLGQSEYNAYSFSDEMDELVKALPAAFPSPSGEKEGAA